MPEARLVPPCSYQGGKQRISRQVVDHIFEQVQTNEQTKYFDVCCGSGAISLELLNRGVRPEQIVMIDISSWGGVWEAIGRGTFDLSTFRTYIDQVPLDKSKIHKFATDLAKQPASEDEIYKYLVLQACSFGGKQIWREEDVWKNAFFRRHWMPTATSVRRSPANVMQPGANALYTRMERITEAARGIRAIRADVSRVLEEDHDAGSVIYVDPPYANTTNYGYEFDLQSFVSEVRKSSSATLFVSEGIPVSPEAVKLNESGARGGISGNRRSRHEEWLSSFKCA